MSSRGIVEERFRTAAAELQVDKLSTMCKAELTTRLLAPHQLLPGHVVQSSAGISCTVRILQTGLDSVLSESLLEREMSARQKITEVVPGNTLELFGVDKHSGTLIEEDASGYQVLQKRILVENKVDHGITCNIARTLATLHRQTHKEKLEPDKFQQLIQSFKDNPATTHHKSQIFTEPFHDDVLADLVPSLRQTAEAILRSQQTATHVATLRQVHEDNRHCLIHGNLNTANILVQDGNVKLQDFSGVVMGPCEYDLGVLVAHYVIAYYQHMLTEQDNSFHRQLSYEMQAAIQKTMETYLEEQTANTPMDGNSRAQLVSFVAGYTALELIRRALLRSDPSQAELSDSARLEILKSGQRLINRYENIHNTGRLLMIGLQLC